MPMHSLRQALTPKHQGLKAEYAQRAEYAEYALALNRLGANAGTSVFRVRRWLITNTSYLNPKS